MEAATSLGLPWRMLRDKLVTLDPDTQLVKYSTTFDKLSDNSKTVSRMFPLFRLKIKPSQRFEEIAFSIARIAVN